MSSMEDRRDGGSWARDKVCVSLWKEPVVLGEDGTGSSVQCQEPLCLDP